MQDSSVGKTLEGDLDENGFTLFLRIPDQSGSNVPDHNLVPNWKTVAWLVSGSCDVNLKHQKVTSLAMLGKIIIIIEIERLY